MEPPVNVRFQVGRFEQALTALVFCHVVVANFDRHRANATTLRAHRGEQIVSHPAQDCLGVFLVGDVHCERLLLAERFGRVTDRHDRTLVDALGELPDRPGRLAEQELEQLQRSRTEVFDLRQARRVES